MEYMTLFYYCYSGLQRTVWHSFAMAISGNYEAGVADTVDLDLHKPVTVETTYVSRIVFLCAARTIP